MKRFILCTFCFFLIAKSLYASNEVTYLMNLPTCQTTGNDLFLFDVGHRYLDVNRHTTNINITLGYGITNWLDIYTGFAFKNKDIVASVKANILNDLSSNAPFSLALVLGGGYKDTNEVNNSISLTYADKDGRKAETVLDSKDRPSYFAQIVLQKHALKNRLSLGLVPTYAYNTNFYGIESKHDYSAGCGISAALYIFDRLALTGEVIMNVYGFAFKYMNYNVGIKYAGYRHTFTLWVGNCAGYSPVEYIVGNTVTTPKLSFAFTREFDL
jgi:hypothetical protein